MQPARLTAALMIGALLASAYFFARTGALDRVDFLLYDNFLNWEQHRASDQVVVVAIDDASLRRLGRWPWSRRLHAELLDRLTAMGARAVGFDIIFAEPEHDDPTADARFGAAIARNGRTVVAVAPNNPLPGRPMSEVLPLALLAESAAGLGHVDIEIDADGLCRSFHLYAGAGDAHWPTIALALLQAGGGQWTRPSTTDERPFDGLSPYWARHGRYFVPFDPRPEALQIIPYHEVLSDPTVAERIAGRYVLVGSTAVGLGDVVSTPVSLAHQRMPGVELNAHILGGLLNDTLTRRIDDSNYLGLTLLVAATTTTLLVTASFPVGFLLFVICITGTLALSAVLLFSGQLWFPPAAALAPLFLGFPLWGTWSLLNEKRLNRSLKVRIQHQALHHAATDLPNQYVLEERLRALDSADKHDDRVASLMIVHIKWPGSASEMLGQVVSDQLLRAVADRLTEVVNEGGLIAHLNGDDFGILLDRLENAEDALRIAQRVLNALQRPVRVDDAQVFLSPRMGLSIWPTESPDGGALIRDAYVAMFRARVEQSTRTCVYSEKIAREAHARSQLEQALVSAMEREEFEVYYQPQVVTESGRIAGVEALLRWHNPKLGLVYPGTFIPVAEHNGQIHEIGAWVLRTACRQVQEWNAMGLGPLRLAVNLSPLQFANATIVQEVVAALDQSGLPAEHLELEITESTLMENVDQARAAMTALKGLGVQLAIDDFGTGYSALSNLQRFPLDRIKIDQSFTRELEVDANVREITLTIIGMAKRLQLAVIAEGVERQTQLAFLGQHGCDEMQGFYFGHPLPAADIRLMLQAERGAEAGGRQETATGGAQTIV